MRHTQEVLTGRNINKAAVAVGLSAILFAASCIPTTQNYPKPEIIPPNPASTPKKQNGCPDMTLGIKSNDPETFQHIKELCLGMIRIDIDTNTTFKDLKKGEELIKKAQASGLKVVGSFVTHRKSESDVRLVAHLAEKYPDMIFELGNEVDNPIILFWVPDESDLNKYPKDLPYVDKSLEVFADHFTNMFKAIKSVNPDAEIILTANVDVGNTVKLLKMINKRGIDTSSIYAGNHFYNTTNDVEFRMTQLLTLLNRENIRVRQFISTEIGARAHIKTEVPRMIKAAKSHGVNGGILIHEFSDTEGFGCTGESIKVLDPKKCQPIKDYAIHNGLNPRNNNHYH